MNNPFLKIITAALILIITNSLDLFGQEKDTKEIYPGIVYEKIINKKDRLVINILSVDLKNKTYLIDAVKANNMLASKEATSSLSARLNSRGINVIAAVNADFWEPDGEIVNNMISNGTFVKAVSGHSDVRQNRIFSQFALTRNDKPLIERFDFKGKIFFKDGSSAAIDRINSRTDSSKITLYNSYQGNETPMIHKDWNSFEAGLKPAGTKGDTLLFVPGGKFNYGGETPVPANGFVLSSNNDEARLLEEKITKDDTLKVLLNLVPNCGNIFMLTGGIPRIVKDGKNLAAESDTLDGMKTSFTVTQHPRTGIGISKDSTKLFLFTVDGRQESSSGMSLKEFADLMLRHGVYQGLNLDGGGSTTMVIDGKVVNHPSDKTGERPVGSCLVIIKK